MTAEDIAMRIFGLCVVTFPALMAAVRYFLFEDSGFEKFPGGKDRIALILLLSYVTLLGAMVSSGYILAGITGQVGDVAVFMIEGFALIPGIVVITYLKQDTESIWVRGFSTILIIVFSLMFAILVLTALKLSVGYYLL